jgi:fumarate hydratase class II
MPRAFVAALGLIKWAAARVNRDLGELEADVAGAIESAALEIAEGGHYAEFPIDVFQTGSGTSSNMNANEVVARLATTRLGRPVHPNDHVNMGQSSNDVVPTAIHLSAAIGLRQDLLPSLKYLSEVIEKKAKDCRDFVKTGRTHLMDAMPVRLDQELGGWAAQIRANGERLAGVLPRLARLAQGGTAVGTGINAHPEFGARMGKVLESRTGIAFRPAESFFEALSCQDTAVELSGQLKTTAVSLMKIANDLRWMNSGPLAGLGEIALPSLQPGSSIMPGKVNPVIPEAAAMVAAQVIGNDATITIAGQSGNFQLNVMLPIVALNLLQSIELLANVSYALADSAIKGFKVNKERLDEALERNPILVTALNPVIGYEKGAAVAKQAYKEGRPIRDVAAEQTQLTPEQLRKLLDPLELTKGGIKG